MTIIADSGSTKCDWLLLDCNGNRVLKETTAGINPQLLGYEEITHVVHSAKQLMQHAHKVAKIMFFGAGCINDSANISVEKALTKYFCKAQVSVQEDIYIAVRGTTDCPGVVCILGTGSNCCFFDGQEIEMKIPSLGYLVMDDGGGNYFGKKLLRDFFYKKMPSETEKSFKKSFNLESTNIVKQLYHVSNPSSYLASFAYFLNDNRNDPYVKGVINQVVKDVFDNLIKVYDSELHRYPLHFVGSMAYLMKDEITVEAERNGYRVGSFVRRPLDSFISKTALETS